MRKYLCLWCMSTKNHNILCFVYVPGIKLLNKGIYLWKAPKALARRGFPPAKICPKTGASSGNRNRTIPKPKPSPRRCWGQDAETVHFRGMAVRVVEIWGGYMRKKSAGTSNYRHSLLEVRLVRNHLLMQDAHNQEFIW
jgi:hypothetical protein